MGYFDGLASGVIKKDQQGRGVYYPWGIIGKGYIMPDEASETKIKKLLILTYQLFFVLIFVHLFLFKHIIITTIFGVSLIVWFLIKSRQITAGCEISSEKLTLREAYTNSAQKHNLLILWFLLIISLVFTLFGLLALLVGKVGFGLFLTLMFGATSYAIAYMIKVKKTHHE